MTKIKETKPVETTEDPPRPVRVLFDKDGRPEAVHINHNGSSPSFNLFAIELIGSGVAWMRGGSPVPGDEDASALRNSLEWVQKVEAERDHWKAKSEALQVEVDRMGKALLSAIDRRAEAELESRCAKDMRPVVDAAVAWVANNRVMRDPHDADLFARVRSYQSKQAPAEPVKNCTTCRHCCWPCCELPLEDTRECSSAGLSKWEPRHD